MNIGTTLSRDADDTDEGAMQTKDLDELYAARSATEIRNRYEAWASRYDRENLAMGFRLPGVGAAYLARHLPRDATPFLDAGCGTGLVGEALAVLGYGEIVGVDISPRMLEIARGLGVYRRLAAHDLGQPLGEPDDAYAAFICLGSFGPGHAPPECLVELVRVVRPGGYAVFNLIEDTYVEQGFADEMARLERADSWYEVERSPAFRAYLLGDTERLTRVFVYRITA